MVEKSVLSLLTSTGGSRRKRSSSRTKKRRNSRCRKGSKGATTKSDPIDICGKFIAYDVAKKTKVEIENPKLVKIDSCRGKRAMIIGTSPLSGNKVVTFVSTKDSRVSKHF